MPLLHSVSNTDKLFSEIPSWVKEAYDEFDRKVNKKDFPCLLGITAHRKKLTQIGFIENDETNKGLKLAELMKEYAELVESTENDKIAGLLPLVIFIQRKSNENLESSQERIWDMLCEAASFDEKEWLVDVPKDPRHKDFIYTFAGHKWFINVSSYCHKKRKSRNLGSHIVLAMQTLYGSNRFYSNHEEKLNWQRRIRERTEIYDGMEVYEGLGKLDSNEEPKPLIESYFLPDTNDEEKYKFWEVNRLPFQVALFDFDGTLADTAQCGVEATQSAFVECGLAAPSKEAIIHFMGIPIEKSFKEMGAADFNEDEFAHLLTVFRRHYAAKSDTLISLYQGCLPLLQKLKTHNIKTAIISSKKSNVLKNNAAFLGIDGYIELFVGSDTVKAYKPDPDGIFSALKQLDHSELNDVIYIGDADSDILMGNAAGIQTCAVTWGAHSEENLLKAKPTYLVRNFNELENTLLLNKCPFHQL